MTVSKEHLCDRNPFPLPMHGSAPASHLCLWVSPSWPPSTSLMLLRVWAMLFSDAATLQIFPTEDGYEPSSASPQSSAVAICHWDHCWSKLLPLSPPGPPWGCVMANGTAQRFLTAVQWKAAFSQVLRQGMISKTRNAHSPSQAVLLEGLPKSLQTPRRHYTPARSWVLCLSGQLRAANQSK